MQAAELLPPGAFRPTDIPIEYPRLGEVKIPIEAAALRARTWALFPNALLVDVEFSFHVAQPVTYHPPCIFAFMGSEIHELP